MTTGPAPATARVERLLPTTPPDAYDAWLDEATLAAFINPAPGTAEVSVDARVGGGLRIVMTFPDRTVLIEGEYLLLDRPNRISFTWRVDSQRIESVVTVTFEPAGDETLMTILHSQLTDGWLESYQRGWGVIADALAAMPAPG